MDCGLHVYLIGSAPQVTNSVGGMYSTGDVRGEAHGGERLKVSLSRIRV